MTVPSIWRGKAQIIRSRMHWRWFGSSLFLLEIFSSHRNGWATHVREKEISTRVYLAWPIPSKTKFRNWFYKRWLKWTIFSLIKPVRWRSQVRQCLFLRSNGVELVRSRRGTDRSINSEECTRSQEMYQCDSRIRSRPIEWDDCHEINRFYQRSPR